MERRSAEVVGDLDAGPGIEEGDEHGRVAATAGGVDYRFAELVAGVGVEAGAEEGAGGGGVGRADGFGEGDAVGGRLVFLLVEKETMMVSKGEGKT